MLKTFIRFTPTDYCIEEQTECIQAEQAEHCEEFFDTHMIAKAGDQISFIVDKSDFNIFINPIHLRAALTTCGVVSELSIANIFESNSQYYFNCFLPDNTENGEYEITIYKNYQLAILSYTPETTEGACDSTLTVGIVSPPAIDFEYSINTIDWNDTGVFTGLCREQYTIYVREVGDTDCISGTIEFNATPANCGDYKGFTLQQMIDEGIFLNQLYDCTLDDIKP